MAKGNFCRGYELQSVSKSSVQTPSLWGSHLPPTPIKKRKKIKPSDQNEMFDSNSLHSRLCAESSGSNPSMMVPNTKHMAQERCSHLILKTNTDNRPPPPPAFGATPYYGAGQTGQFRDTFRFLSPLLLPMEDNFGI